MATVKSRSESGGEVALPGTRALRLLKVRRKDELVRKVQSGFDVALLGNLVEASGLTGERIAAMTGISKRTLRRRQASGHLTADESDRLLRASRIFEMALDLFEGNAADARRWLLASSAALGGSAPIEYASTEVGAREVEQLIGRLMHGVFA